VDDTDRFFGLENPRHGGGIVAVGLVADDIAAQNTMQPGQHGVFGVAEIIDDNRLKTRFDERDNGVRANESGTASDNNPGRLSGVGRQGIVDKNVWAGSLNYPEALDKSRESGSFLKIQFKPGLGSGIVKTMNENELKALISLLDDDDPEISTHVEARIRAMGSALIPTLEREWEASPQPELQQKIEELIHDLQYEAVLERIGHWRDGGAMDLLEGLWIVATYQYPTLSLDKLRKDMQQLFYDVWLDITPDMHPVDQIKALNNVFYNKLKFAPNTKNFHSPTNSMINQVLETRRGNPISMCLIYMMIANKLGLPVYGVNLPNLFVLTYKNQNGVQFYINVFTKGLVFSKKDIDLYIGQLNLQELDTFYQPCTNLDIVRRMLRNLMLAFDKAGDRDRKKEVEHIMNTIRDDADHLPLSDYTQK
jgi:regulator of sirC expression with transglutaminase-like and TPR domain